MLNKRIPYNLKELVLQKIKLRPNEAQTLMQILTLANLKRLSLDRLNISNSQSLSYFLEYLKVAELEDIDLRDSTVSNDQFLEIVHVISRNKKLRFLNLSSNNLVKPIKDRFDRKGNVIKDKERPEL